VTSKDRIQAAALRLFARHGFEGVGLQRIADEVGLHKSSLFHHYKGKVELANDVFQIALREVVARVRPLASDPPSLDGLFAAVDELVDYLSDHPDAARLFLQGMAAPLDSPVDEPHASVEIFTILWSWLERARRVRVIRHVNLRQALFNLIGVVLFYPAVAEQEPELAGPDPFSPTARRHRKQELRIALRGMLAPSAV
jgi:AcrR family transcriptional regulator